MNSVKSLTTIELLKILNSKKKSSNEDKDLRKVVPLDNLENEVVDKVKELKLDNKPKNKFQENKIQKNNN